MFEEQQRLKRYYIFKLGDSIRYYVNTDKIFKIMNQTQIATGYGGRTSILKDLLNKYRNITQEQVTTRLTLCKPCQKNRKF